MAFSLLNPTSWSLNGILLPKGTLPPGTDLGLIKRQRVAVGIIFASVFLLSRGWLSLVTHYIQEPYLDEAFHVPQAQKYCKGDFSWDPMITTPPGLYGTSLFLIQYVGRGVCTTHNLRYTNVVALLALLFISFDCRQLIEQASIEKQPPSTKGEAKWVSSYTIHTAVNICLFPPVFFFSGLYYTDVLSTCFVVLAYKSFLQHKNSQLNFNDAVIIIGLGIFAMLMRQTNIIWVGVFTAALEGIRSSKAMDYKPFSRYDQKEGLGTWLQKSVLFFARGNIHDPSLQNASVMDLLVSPISIAIAAATKLPSLLKRIWPYMFLISSFVAFVLWNGSVVLGDKSHHVATIHLPQMLYIWPFMAMFSLPLLYPYGIEMIKTVAQFIAGTKPLLTLANARFSAWLLLSLLTTLCIVHFNTIIHPYTLADNRHYVFYAFRYTIRAHPLVKYALTPVYLISCLLIFRTLAGHPAQVVKSGLRKGTGAYFQPQVLKWSWIRSKSPQSTNPSSFLLVWVFASALCLITAPLVEPRYYIVSWVLWRLHVPALPTTSRTPDAAAKTWTAWFHHYAYLGHDHRLWLETIWFMAINIVTGYILLFRGFSWESEPGKVQRFMY